MINRDSWEHSYLIVGVEILGRVQRRTSANAFAKDVFIDQGRKRLMIRYRRSLNRKPCRLEIGGR